MVGALLGAGNGGAAYFRASEVIAAIDALSTVLSGDPAYFHGLGAAARRKAKKVRRLKRR
jgi:hypothetical protein